MLDQLDMFAPSAAPAPASAIHIAGDVEYTVVAKSDRWAINSTCGDRSGAIGGLYVDEAEAWRCIAFREELRAAGIVDPRPCMRTPPEGARP